MTQPPNRPDASPPGEAELPPWRLLGGDEAACLARLEAILDDFYDRVFTDLMIGFLFRGSDKARLVRTEAQLTARMLGADVPYEGRSMPRAHRRSPILGGHFARRQQILREVLADHDVPERVREAWLEHNERLRPQVTRDAGTECVHRDPAS